MKVIIFGTGKKYQESKSKLRKNIEIAAFVDNDSSKWGNKLDGVLVISPQKIPALIYDFIFLLSTYYREMRKQLLEAGIPAEKLYDVNQIERICETGLVKYYGELKEYEDSKKVLFFSHALSSTGAQNVLFHAVRVLKEKGYHLAVVSKTDGILREALLKLDIPVIIMENPHTENTDFTKMIQWADLIFVNTVWLYYIVEEILGFHKKVKWWVHEADGFEHLKEAVFTETNPGGCLTVYAVSPLVKRKMIQTYGKRFHVKELVFGLPYYEARGEKGNFHDRKIFAIISGIGWIKGQDIFIKAVEKLPESYRNKAEFWIVGGGKLAQEDIRRAQLFPCIKLTGEIENQKMPDLYSKIDVVVCCSRKEAMSVVVAEGCMNGKLVIVSDAAGIADYITNGEDGLIFQSENIKQLTELMQWTLEHEEEVKKIGARSRRIYQEHFLMERFEKELQKAVEE